MLPFVRHNTLKIPHGLAALAAVVCLGLAFTSDIQTRLETKQANAAADSTVDVVVKVPELSPKEQAADSEPSRSSRADPSAGGWSGFLLPWLPRLRSAG